MGAPVSAPNSPRHGLTRHQPPPQLALAGALSRVGRPTPAHLVSWAGLSPVAQQSGRRPGKAKKGKGDAYLKGHCGQAALGASKTGTFPGARHRRLAKRIGGAKAQVAVARTILVIIWHLLADPAARYTELGPDWHTRHAGNRARKIRGHLRELEALGIDTSALRATA